MSRWLTQVEAEMLKALWHLRYLSSQQIQRQWYPERTLEACIKRLSRLGEADILRRVRIDHRRWQAAWTLGTGGYSELRQLFDGDWVQSKPVTTMFLPHLLETNEVFGFLSGGIAAWESLPFVWRGSHRAAINFTGFRRGAGLGVSVSQRLTPDAIIEPCDPRRSRVFFELDRSTEPLRQKSALHSIERKLSTYREFMLGFAPGEAVRNYDKEFTDGRRARIVFVLSKLDTRSVDPRFRDRRLRAIATLAEDIFERRPSPLQCVYLDDIEGLRRVFGSWPAAPAKPPVTRVGQRQLAPDDLRALVTFYEQARQAHVLLGPRVPIHVSLKDSGRRVFYLLQSLDGSLGAELREFRTMPGAPR